MEGVEERIWQTLHPILQQNRTRLQREMAEEDGSEGQSVDM